MPLKKKEPTKRTTTSRTADFKAPAKPRGFNLTARNERQKELMRLYKHSEILAAIGPAGTGKTFVMVALAVQSLLNPDCPVEKLIISRPILEAGGDRLGYLPGGIKEKTDPYMRPIFDALDELLGAPLLEKLLLEEVIEVVPLAYTRGRTYKNCIAILDESQNATIQEIFMFLTRMGDNSKMMLNGDETQVDLPRSVPSGLPNVCRILAEVPGFNKIEFTAEDVVRHPMVARVIEAFARERKTGELLDAFVPHGRNGKTVLTKVV